MFIVMLRILYPFTKTKPLITLKNLKQNFIMWINKSVLHFSFTKKQRFEFQKTSFFY